jgi:hypothetical protein
VPRPSEIRGHSRDAEIPRECAAVPLRISRRGRLVRGDPWRALEQLIGVMLLTPAQALRHAPWFGLHEILVNPDAQRDAEIKRDLEPALTEVLKELNVTWATVEPDSLEVVTNEQSCERMITFALVATDGSGMRHDVSLADANFR